MQLSYKSYNRSSLFRFYQNLENVSNLEFHDTIHDNNNSLSLSKRRASCLEFPETGMECDYVNQSKLKEPCKSCRYTGGIYWK